MGVSVLKLATPVTVNMSPRLSISDIVIKRLKNLEPGSFGGLLGVCDEKSVLVLGLHLVGTPKEDDRIQEIKSGNNDIVLNLPGGIDQCGLFEVSNEDLSNKSRESLLAGAGELPVVISIDDKTKKVVAAFYRDGKSEKTDYAEVNENALQKLLAHFRLTATIPLCCDMEVTYMESTLNELEKKILSGDPAFQFEEKNIYILGDRIESINGVSSKAKIDEFLNNLDLSSKKINNEEKVIIRVQMYMNQTNCDESPQTAPYIKYVKKEFKHGEIQFSFDTLVTTLRSLSITQLYRYLIDGTHRNFILNKINLLDQLQKRKLHEVGSPETYHFFPSELGHFFSIIYGPQQNLDETKGIRESFHKSLALSLNRPLFRPANAYVFINPNKTESNILLNPHEKVPKSGVVDGECCLVQGTYAYHHYMQDNMNDSGWGCAYRSLQTIFSWFRYQGYTTAPVPSHREIQQCLVRIGDKPESFVNSQQWIGSTEVSFVLETMLGVTSRIVNVSSGEEMTMKGGELSHHFKTQGTPIMIGGGVLAHTIIGVDYNKHTGNIKFLILDPHYTGEEDVGVVVKKGFCGWKGPEFWKKDAFYNMCLPLKPKGV